MKLHTASATGQIQLHKPSSVPGTAKSERSTKRVCTVRLSLWHRYCKLLLWRTNKILQKIMFLMRDFAMNYNGWGTCCNSLRNSVSTRLTCAWRANFGLVYWWLNVQSNDILRRKLSSILRAEYLLAQPGWVHLAGDGVGRWSRWFQSEAGNDTARHAMVNDARIRVISHLSTNSHN